MMKNDPTPLAQLKDLHLPPAISAWPPAIGWWLLAFLLGCLIATLSFFAYRYWQRNRAKYKALQQLQALQTQYPSNGASETLRHLSILLKRTLLAYYPRHQVAGLHGETLLAFLDESGKTDDFSCGMGRLLIYAPYQKQVNVDIQPLFAMIKRYIKNIPQKGPIDRQEEPV